MQPDDHPTLNTTDRPQATALSWVKNPWVILIFGGVMLLAVWVGIGIWTEQRRSAAIEELKDRYGVLLQSEVHMGIVISFPDWLNQMVPPGWAARSELITSAQVDNCDGDRILRLLSRIGELEQVNFTADCTFSDDALLELIETHQLRGLGFQVPRRMTPQHLAALRQRGGVNGSLSLRGPFDERHLYELGQMAELEILRLTGPISANAAVPTTAWPALQELQWDDSQLTDAQFAMFGAASRLNALYLSKTRLTSRSGPLLERLPVEALHLESPDLDDTLMENLSRIPSLEHLSLPHTGITDVGLQAVARLPKLTSLRMAARDLTVSSARSLRECADLNEITLDTDASVTDEWIAEMLHERFWRIELVNSAITDEGVAAIQKGCPNAYVLWLPGSRVTDRCLSILHPMRRLIDLKLSNTAITDAGLQQVELATGKIGFSFRGRLDLSGTRVTREGALEFLRRNGNSNLTVRLGPDDVVHRPPEPPGWIVCTPE